jgi:transglutaminase-like putative cysteine protease
MTLAVLLLATAAQVLLREENVTVAPSGEQTVTLRRVIEVLTVEGAAEAKAELPYDGSADRILTCRATLRSPDGETRSFTLNDFTDRALLRSELHSTLRYRSLNVAALAEPGSVFTFEATLQHKSLFNQLEYEFQGHLPVKLSRFTLVKPAGLSLQAHLFDVPASVRSSESTWTLENLPANPRVTPRLAITLSPDASSATWPAVANWLAAQADSADGLTPTVQAQAEQLTAGSSDPIGALARFVQQLRYVAITRDLASGAGFAPQPAERVLALGYGDCKDKANLLRMLLRAIGVNSHLVAINSTDEKRVRAEWPSPRGFNHAILAVETAKGVVFFDPSNPFVPFGEIPLNLENRFALPMTAGAALLTTPVGVHSLTRSIHLELTAVGDLTGRLLETAIGQPAAENRALLAGADHRARLSAWLRTPDLRRVETANQPHSLFVEYHRPDALRPAGAELLLFNPLLPTDPAHLTETVTVNLSACLAVEELPEPVQTANFSAVWFVRAGKLVVERQYRPGSSLPPAVESLPIVLRRVPCAKPQSTRSEPVLTTTSTVSPA